MGFAYGGLTRQSLRRTFQRDIIRARIVLMADEDLDLENQEIAQRRSIPFQIVSQ